MFLNVKLRNKTQSQSIKPIVNSFSITLLYQLQPWHYSSHKKRCIKCNNEEEE